MAKPLSIKDIYPYSEKIDFALCDGLMILARKGQTNQKKSTMSFESDKRFNDFKHFPRGLRRSGEFTVAEADSLENTAPPCSRSIRATWLRAMT